MDRLLVEGFQEFDFDDAERTVFTLLVFDDVQLSGLCLGYLDNLPECVGIVGGTFQAEGDFTDRTGLSMVRCTYPRLLGVFPLHTRLSPAYTSMG